jgi:hypothetical protein
MLLASARKVGVDRTEQQIQREQKMNTLHRISQAEILAILENHARGDAASFAYNLGITGNWSGDGKIELAAPSGSSTGPFHDVISFSLTATSSFGIATFAAVDLAFVYWNIGPAGSLTSFSILTNQVNGFSVSMQLGQAAARLEGKKFATLEIGTLTHSGALPTLPQPVQRRPATPWLRTV